MLSLIYFGHLARPADFAQIRLQRADVAIEIAKRARATLAIENMEAGPVPNKILIPLIEKASNEASDDTFMIDRWAHLLATASTSNDVEPRFVGIFGELNGRQAKALEDIAKNYWEHFEYPITLLEDADSDVNEVFVRKDLDAFFAGKKSSPAVDKIYDAFHNWLNRPGAVVVDIIVFDKDGEMYSYKLEPGLGAGVSGSTDLDLEILASLGLLKRVDFFYNSKFEHEIRVFYYHMTELGVRFFLSSNRDMKSAAVDAQIRTEREFHKKVVAMTATNYESPQSTSASALSIAA
jgi:hypothetical protein